MRTHPRHRLLTTLALGLVATLLAGCAAGGMGGGTTPEDSTAPEPTESPTPALPTDPDALLIGVRDEGGFVMPEFQFGRLPQIAIYADGRVIQQGAQLMIFPGALVPPLFVTKLDEASLLALLEAAGAAGLTSGANTAYPATSVVDAPDTVFAVRGENGLTETRFGAFGMDQMGLPAAEVEARQKAATFLAAVQAAVNGPSAGAGEPYTPTAARLLVRDYTPQAEFPQEPVDWPLASLATGGTAWFAGQPELGRCVVLDAEDLATVWPLLGGANSLTPFVSDGKQFSLVVRPLLPDEEPICP